MLGEGTGQGSCSAVSPGRKLPTVLASPKLRKDKKADFIVLGKILLLRQNYKCFDR